MPLLDGQEPAVTQIVDDLNHPLLSLSFNAASTGKEERIAQRRHINFATLNELWTFYKTDTPTSEQVSRSSFDRAFNRSWKKYLILMSPQGGNKCTICLKNKEARSAAISNQEKMELDIELQQHLEIVKKDRSVSSRGNIKGSQIENFKENSDGFLKLMIDGMDQQKFAIPRSRRLNGASDYGKSWKSLAHVVGVVAWGVAEIYFLMKHDCKKDASMQATVTSRALDIVNDIVTGYGPGFQVPRHLLVSADNTPRESKNQFYAQYLSKLAGEVFETVELQFLQVSHTHNELDQRFSTMATIIKRAEQIDSLHSLKDYLTSHMTAAAGRQLHIEILDNTWSFASWIMKNAQVGGLTSTRLHGGSCGGSTWNRKWLNAIKMTGKTCQKIQGMCAWS